MEGDGAELLIDLKQMVKDNPNDAELGAKLRQFISEFV